MENLSNVKDSTQRLSDLDWNVNDIFDRRVIKATSWCDLDDYHSLEVRTGVFVFVNLFFQVKYIGIADDGLLIAEIREAIKAGKSNGALLVKVLYTRAYEKSEALAQEMLKKYNPINNQ